MANNLYQKCHGLPGIGVKGVTGMVGEKGNSIYIGFVNDFFDGIEIDLDAFVKVAKRYLQDENDKNIENAYKAYVEDCISAAKAINNVSGASNVSIDEFLKKYLMDGPVYYTGQVLSADDASTLNSISKNVANADIYKNMSIDIADNVVLMVKMLYDTNPSAANTQNTSLYDSYKNKRWVEIDINNITATSFDGSKDYQFSTLYNYTEIGGVNQLINNVQYNNVFMPYESNDAARLELNSNTTYYDYNNAVIYTSLANDGKTEIALSYPTFVKESFNNEYVQDTNTCYSEIVLNTKVLRTFINDNYNYINRQNIGNVTVPNTYFAQHAIKILSLENQDLVNKRLLIDSDDYVYCAIDETSLYTNDAAKNLKSLNEITNSLYSPIAQNNPDFLTNYSTEISSYYSDIATSATIVWKDIPQDKQIDIRWVQQDEAKLFIPFNLKDIYKDGDTLYFYTNQSNWKKDSKIEYMVSIHKKIEKCNLSTLLSQAQLTNPFQVKYLFEQNDRAVTNNNIGINVANSTNQLGKLSNLGITNIIDQYTNAKMSLTKVSRLNNSYITCLTNDSSIQSFNVYNYDINSITISSNILKFDNLYTTNTPINVETYAGLYDDNIILTNGFIESVTSVYSYEIEGEAYLGCPLYAKTYFKNTNSDSHAIMYGYEVYENNSLLYTNYSTTEDLQILVKLNKTLTSFKIVTFAIGSTGIKYFSKYTNVNVQYTTSNKVVQVSKYTLNIEGDNKYIINNTSNYGNIQFTTDSVTADECTVTLTVQTLNANKKVDKIAKIKAIYFNKLSSDDFTNNPASKWATISNNVNSPMLFEYSINLLSNIPNIVVNPDGRSPVAQSITDYMTSGSDINTGDNNCDLFKYINAGNVLPHTNPRSIVVTCVYTLGQSTTEYYENFEITQPGFQDNRGLPTIDLKMYNSFKDLEKINSINNGVLTNQFVTYLDIKVSDIAKKWCQYLENSDEVKVSLTIENIDTDIDWQDKYVIQTGLFVRDTIKILPYNDRILTSTSDSSLGELGINNHIALNAELVDSTKPVERMKLSSPAITINDALNITGEAVGKISQTTTLIDSKASQDKPKTPYFTTTINNKEYIAIDESVMSAIKDPFTIYNGILKKIKIDINNVNFQHIDNKTIRLRLVYECGNPMLANLYLKFAVTHCQITYNTNTFSVYAHKDSKSINTDNLLYSLSETYDELYKVKSNVLDVMFNPVSCVLCADDAESDITYMQGDIYKTGSNQQITQKLSFYGAELYDNTSIMDISDINIRNLQLFKWDALKLKARYLQDNITKISVKNVDIKSIKNYISNSYNYYNLNELCKLNAAGGNISVVYHSALMNPRWRNDKYTFYYNSDDYDKTRYDQLINNYPVFIHTNSYLPVRTNELIESMDAWNEKYSLSEKSDMDNTYTGVINLYGNGYNYLLLDDENDVILLNKSNELKELHKSIISQNTKQLLSTSLEYAVAQINQQQIANTKKIVSPLIATKISVNNISKTKNTYYTNAIGSFTAQEPLKYSLSLKETKELNNKYIYNYSNIIDIEHVASSLYQPKTGKYFRTFLYDLYLDYPMKINENTVMPYQIISDFDYLLYYNSQYNPSFNDPVYGEHISNVLSKNKNIVPYSFLYDLNTRIAYNDDFSTINVLMLRRPCIEKDSDEYIIPTMDIVKIDGYELTKRYFNLGNGQTIKKLTIPYTIV